MYLKQLCFILAILIPNLVCLAQQIPGSLNRMHNLLLEKKLNSTDTATFSSFKPYLLDLSSERALQNSYADKNKPSVLCRKLKYEHLVVIDTSGFYLTIDPVFNLELGFDLKDSSALGDTTQLYVNTRGILIRGSIGEKVSFKSVFYENQAFFPAYLNDFVKRYDVVPGQGRTKRFKTTGFDFASSSGLISINPIKSLNVQLGTGKNFIGDGYRSLILSDNSFNYPFVKLTTTYRNFRYTNLLTSFLNLNVELPTSGTTERRFQRKIGSFHHLDISLGNKINIGLFEGMIWNSSETNGAFNRERDVYNFLNPIPFIRPLTYGLRQGNNAIVGVNMKYKISDSWMLYSQLVLDDGKSKKSGLQLGLKAFNFLGIDNLHIQSEINKVNKYTYAHADSKRSFTHYNQAIAHPIGAGFFESVSIVNYMQKNFFVEMKINYAKYNEDSLGYYNNGKDIFKSDLNSIEVENSPIQAELMVLDIKLGYLVNPKTNMQILLGVSNRIEKNIWWEKETQYFYFGIRTHLRNQYYDF